MNVEFYLWGKQPLQDLLPLSWAAQRCSEPGTFPNLEAGFQAVTFFFLIRKTLSPVLSTQWTSFYFLAVCVMWHPDNPQVCPPCPLGGEWGLHWVTRGAPAIHSPHWPSGGTCWPWETRTLCRYWFFCMYSPLSEGNIVPPSALCVESQLPACRMCGGLLLLRVGMVTLVAALPWVGLLSGLVPGSFCSTWPGALCCIYWSDYFILFLLFSLFLR